MGWKSLGACKPPLHDGGGEALPIKVAWSGDEELGLGGGVLGDLSRPLFAQVVHGLGERLRDFRLRAAHQVDALVPRLHLAVGLVELGDVLDRKVTFTAH